MTSPEVCVCMYTTFRRRIAKEVDIIGARSL